MADPLRGLIRRVFPILLDRASRRHDAWVADRKARLIGDLAGDVLEIGPGTGANFRHVKPGIRWIGVEPNPHMSPYLKRAAARAGVTLDLRDGTAERLPTPDRSVDAVISTLVLCSVADLPRALAETRRVLRPGGRFVFVEHVGARRGTTERRVQEFVRPFWSYVGDGCHPDRDTAAAIRAAGFAEVEIEEFRIGVPIVGPHIAGWARASD
ncbi:MAG: class I SAM-dependent methyltransferase [Chloroflexota bacterium]|nr:MAG: class I SAM-dependent methyltransferase [Chloroflexota bacterium]